MNKSNNNQTQQSTSTSSELHTRNITIEISKSAEKGIVEHMVPLKSEALLQQDANLIILDLSMYPVNTAITLQSGAIIQLNTDGSITFNDNGAYDYLKVGESLVLNVKIIAPDDANFDIDKINLTLQDNPTAAGDNVQNEGQSPPIKVEVNLGKGQVDSLGRDLSTAFVPIQSETESTTVLTKYNDQPRAPLIIMPPVFEVNLRSGGDTESESDTTPSNPNIVQTNIFEEGASFGQDGPGTYSLIPVIRDGITIEDIIANAAAIGFTDPGGISHFYPSNYNVTSFYTDPSGFQVITTPEGNTLTLYTAFYGGYKPGDLVYELLHNVPHIEGLPGISVVSLDLGLQVGEQQLFVDPFSYYISDSNGDVASNQILALIFDDSPFTAAHNAFIDEADIQTIGSHELSSQASVSGSLIDEVNTGFGADGGIVSNVTIEGGSTIIDPENNLITVTTKEGNILEVQQTTGNYVYYLNAPIDNDSASGATDTQGFDNFTFELTDFDFDQKEGLLTITIADDNPIVIDNYSSSSSTANYDLAVDETNLHVKNSIDFPNAFTIIPGADQTQSLEYKLSISQPNVDTGLIDTLTNEAITLSVVGNKVIGSSATGGEVFNLIVDNAGLVTLDQGRAVRHSDDSNANDISTLINNILSLTVTIVDNDQDPASKTIQIGNNIQFYDDAPTVTLTASATANLTIDETILNTPTSGSFSGLFSVNFGNDGFKDSDNNDVQDTDAIKYQLDVKAIAVDSGLKETLSGQDIVMSKESNDIVGRTLMGGIEVFRISVDENSGVVTLNQKLAVVHPTT
ncbi:MAG: DUF5801 repeats-in-toxin domain-containing protein, partial [Candidatus Berkiella sp.]